MSLPQKIVAVHEALKGAQLPHAFGGALALAWCTGRARGTIDIDINIFVAVAQCDAVFAALPEQIVSTPQERKLLQRDGQVRLWWGHTPVDIFLNTTDFHLGAAERVRWETFLDMPVPFISCYDIAVFKAFFNRTKDWADLEEMQAAGTLDINRVIAQLVEMLDVDDERVERLIGLKKAAPEGAAW